MQQTDKHPRFHVGVVIPALVAIEEIFLGFLNTRTDRGFCRLVKDYYPRLIKDNIIEESHKTKIAEKFQGILEGQFLNYITQSEHRDYTWEELYMSTLSNLGVDAEDQLSIIKIFQKIN